MSRDFKDTLGRDIKEGDAIAYAHTARGCGISLYEVVGFTPQTIKAKDLHGRYSGHTNLKNPEEALILSDSPETMRGMVLPYWAQRALGKTCHHCRKGKLDRCLDDDGKKVLALGCDGCGGMFDLDYFTSEIVNHLL